MLHISISIMRKAEIKAGWCWGDTTFPVNTIDGKDSSWLQTLTFTLSICIKDLATTRDHEHALGQLPYHIL